MAAFSSGGIYTTAVKENHKSMYPPGNWSQHKRWRHEVRLSGIITIFISCYLGHLPYNSPMDFGFNFAWLEHYVSVYMAWIRVRTYRESLIFAVVYCLNKRPEFACTVCVNHPNTLCVEIRGAERRRAKSASRSKHASANQTYGSILHSTTKQVRRAFYTLFTSFSSNFYIWNVLEEDIRLPEKPLS